MRVRHLLTTVAVSALLTSGCSLVGNENDDRAADQPSAGHSGHVDHEVTLVTHESFVLPKKLIKKFQQDSGYHLKVSRLDDAGALTNQLVLTKEKPLGDVVFGIDNTFASRAVDEDVFDSYEPKLPDGAQDLELEGDDHDALTPIDSGNVCVNVDNAWFTSHGVPAPTSLDDLTKPAYKDLFVVPGASTSSPGLAFLLATIKKYGDQWESYWKDLTANGAKVVKGWDDAYFTDFTFSGGDRPIVVSYDSSPAFTLDKAKKKSTTSAILDGCFRQVEYAGVLAGKDTNVDGAHAVIDWLLSPEVQAVLPDSMYVFPVDSGVALPADWAKFAKRPETTEQVDPADITEHRSEWLETWTDIVSR